VVYSYDLHSLCHGGLCYPQSLLFPVLIIRDRAYLRSCTRYVYIGLKPTESITKLAVM